MLGFENWKPSLLPVLILRLLQSHSKWGKVSSPDLHNRQSRILELPMRHWKYLRQLWPTSASTIRPTSGRGLVSMLLASEGLSSGKIRLKDVMNKSMFRHNNQKSREYPNITSAVSIGDTSTQLSAIILIGMILIWVSVYFLLLPKIIRSYVQKWIRELKQKGNKSYFHHLSNSCLTVVLIMTSSDKTNRMIKHNVG